MKKIKNIALMLFMLVLTGNLCAFSKKEVIYPKPVVITFYKKNCQLCDKVNEQTKNVKAQYKYKVDFVDVDFTSKDCDYIKLKDKYNIKNAPATIFINSEYGITQKIEGDISEKTYKRHLRMIDRE